MRNRPAALVGIFLTHANDLLGADMAHLPDLARKLEDAGVGYVSVADHIALGPELSAHEALGGSALAYPLDEPYPEPLITLAAVASVTTRMRLMTGVLISPLRPAVLLAKTVATLAALSGGRLDLGIGTGWQQAEYDAMGVPIEEKVTRMDEGLAACRALWRDAPASHRSSTVAFTDLHCFPQPPGGAVPIWFAGKPVAPTLRRVARSGDGWLPIRPLDPDEANAVRHDLDAACTLIGRDPTEVGIRCPLGVRRDEHGALDIAGMRRDIAALHEAGVDGVHLPLRSLARSSDELDDVLPDLGALAEHVETGST